MRREKQFLLDDIRDKITDRKAFILARYNKLEPNTVAGFRTDLAKTGGFLEVVRKRILLKAAQEAKLVIDPKWLEEGHIALIVADTDPIQTTKVIYQFCKDHEEILQVLGGHFEGKSCTAQDLQRLSQLPSLEVMRSQFLAGLEAPLSQTLAVMEALLTSVVYCVDNKSQQSTSRE